MQYDYSPDTLRGAIAACVKARALEIIKDVSSEEGDGHNIGEITTGEAASAMEENPRLYDSLIEVMDLYLDDWANTVVESLGFVR